MSQLSLTLLYEAILGTKLEKERYNDVSTVVTIIKTTKNRSKNILGCLPTSAFFYAFRLGIRQKKNQVLSREREYIARVTDSKGNLILFLGKCSIPFLEGIEILYSP